MSDRVARPSRRCGAIRQSDGSVTWRVWAPRAQVVELVLREPANRTVPLRPEEGGYFSHTEAEVAEGQRYAFRLDGGPERPDPCSLWQPDGVHAASAVHSPERFAPPPRNWHGVRRQDLVIYELHVGTFTPEGTFEAVIGRLASLRELGVTTIELMPVAQFPGERNWGYDGVHPYAAQNSYGGPHGLHALIAACHAHGLAVLLDVVYNHLGPEGNYLNEFGPYFTDRYRTPWGTAMNYDGPGSDAVRDFVLDNARAWLEEFHLDGLRLDATHAVFDLGARHLLRAVKEVADDVAARQNRVLHVIAESDQNDPRLLLPPERGGHGLDGQWADDFHHAVHAFFTGERQGYYQDYDGGPEQLAQVLGRPFLLAWDYSPHRGRKHGAEPPDELTADRFVTCIQNHDQVGNRACGDRLARLVPQPARQRLAASLMLLSPYVPLLFMGEEYGEDRPFPFFCSFGDSNLVEAVREGRRREFADFAWQGEVPDPQAEETFASAKLSWSWPEDGPRAGLRRLYADLLAARRRWPGLRDVRRQPGQLLQGDAPVIELVRGEGEEALRVLFNLGERPVPLPAALSGKHERVFSSESGRYHGARHESGRDSELLPFEVAVFAQRNGTALAEEVEHAEQWETGAVPVQVQVAGFGSGPL